MAANDNQMQVYADQRIRVRAERLRNLLNALADDKASIDEVYARASGNNRWNDARTDGPPTLLQSSDVANPDHVLEYNALISKLLWLFHNIGSADAADLTEFATEVRAHWAVVIDACVRPVEIN